MKIGIEVTTKSVSLKNQAKLLAKKVERGLMAAGVTLLEEASKLVPRDTEALADSGRVTKVGNGFDATAVVGFGGKDFPPRTQFSLKEGRTVTRRPYEYAVFVHQGTVHMAGFKFLHTPLMTKQDQMRQALNEEVQGTD